METIIIETESKEQAEIVKAVLNALNVKFKSGENISGEAKNLAESIVEGYKEAVAIESCKLDAKSYSSFKEMLDDI
jgi:hypothetical protein